MRRTAPAARLDGTRLRFVLSAGRTGTVFLAHALALRGDPVEILHEPWPSRWELVLGNFRNRTGAGGGALRRLFRRARAARLARLPAGHGIVEFNPLLCPLTDLVAGEVKPLTIVHLVREPMSWAHSMLGFRAAGWRRPLIRFVPFAIPYPPRRPPGWREIGDLERALWRWRYCNEQIAKLALVAASYRVLRYEDLFADEPGRRARAYAGLRAGLGLPPAGAGELPDVGRRLNAYEGPPRGLATLEPRAVSEICGPWVERFGYEHP